MGRRTYAGFGLSDSNITGYFDGIRNRLDMHEHGTYEGISMEIDLSSNDLTSEKKSIS